MIKVHIITEIRPSAERVRINDVPFWIDSGGVKFIPGDRVLYLEYGQPIPDVLRDRFPLATDVDRVWQEFGWLVMLGEVPFKIGTDMEPVLI